MIKHIKWSNLLLWLAILGVGLLNIYWIAIMLRTVL